MLVFIFFFPNVSLIDLVKTDSVDEGKTKRCTQSRLTMTRESVSGFIKRDLSRLVL